MSEGTALFLVAAIGYIANIFGAVFLLTECARAKVRNPFDWMSWLPFMVPYFFFALCVECKRSRR